MVSRIQTRHYPALKAIDQPLGPVHALVGANASGKTTFLDVLGLLRDLMRNRSDIRETVGARSSNFEQLVWQESGYATHAPASFSLSVEAPIPASVLTAMRP